MDDSTKPLIMFIFFVLAVFMVVIATRRNLVESVAYVRRKAEERL